ncbi:conserved hypothetical protein [Lodderomyces elongisporus NRRL YB-4239]|uniref:ERT1/acuK family PAS domain-containing protein n=1 Tax=Lodderomyces elongisporus (strain ATCC 11503 / CBS 2605 / JCM 1781 / NBRC 1676 / NRRL YB-4239) TaxID=379508 RepID=A5DS83_LODEL|nr:conserved hypothetical protein [Lodderomyces elongisporus NRRL YB-4239]
MTCDSNRPCSRCVRKGLSETCEDAPRKRKKYLEDVPNSSLTNKHTVSNVNANSSLSTVATGLQDNILPLDGRNSILGIGHLQTPQSSFQLPSHQQPNKTQSPLVIHHQQSNERAPQLYRQHSLLQLQRLPQPLQTHQATMFQHSATAPELTQPLSEQYIENMYQHTSPPQQPPLLSLSLHPEQQYHQTTLTHDHNHLFPKAPTSLNTQASFNNYQKKSKFMSSAADLEYSTLSSILQDTFGGHHTTSNEGTPNSHNFSPTLSPENTNGLGIRHSIPALEGANNDPSHAQHLSLNVNMNLDQNQNQNQNQNPSQAQKLSGSSSSFNQKTHHSLFGNSMYPRCDENINQYFIGKTDGENMTYFPDIITAIEQMKKDDYAVYQERNSKLSLSFSVGIHPEHGLGHYQIYNHHNNSNNNNNNNKDGAQNLLYKEPEEIYAKVQKPFSYTPGYHLLIAYLRNRFSKPMLVKMAESMAAYRPSFIACTNSLKEHDLIFMEQCFQRTLLTYDNFIKISGTPTIVWRRTGEIAYVGDEFCVLTGWRKEQLLGGFDGGKEEKEEKEEKKEKEKEIGDGRGQRKRESEMHSKDHDISSNINGNKKRFIVELLDDESVVEYFQVFSRIAFGDFLGATMTECTLLTPNPDVKIRTGCVWTLKRDVFGIPMMIVGNFLPIL